MLPHSRICKQYCKLHLHSSIYFFSLNFSKFQ
jgi:hypothetical protein